MSGSGLRYRVEPLGRHHNRAAFACGEAELDRYLQQQARQDVSRRVAAVFVLIDTEGEAIAGYYSLSAGSIQRAALPDEITARLPRYPALPVVLLGRLAVDERYQGQRLGQSLLDQALRHSLEQSKNVAAMAVVVDALHERASAFYERYGFRRIADDERRLFLPMAQLAKLHGNDR